MSDEKRCQWEVTFQNNKLIWMCLRCEAQVPNLSPETGRRYCPGNVVGPLAPAPPDVPEPMGDTVCTHLGTLSFDAPASQNRRKINEIIQYLKDKDNA